MGEEPGEVDAAVLAYNFVGLLSATKAQRTLGCTKKIQAFNFVLLCDFLVSLWRLLQDTN